MGATLAVQPSEYELLAAKPGVRAAQHLQQIGATLRGLIYRRALPATDENEPSNLFIASRHATKTVCAQALAACTPTHAIHRSGQWSSTATKAPARAVAVGV